MSYRISYDAIVKASNLLLFIALLIYGLCANGQNTYSKLIGDSNGYSIIEYNQNLYISGQHFDLSALDWEFYIVTLVSTDLEGNVLNQTVFADPHGIESIVPINYYLANYGSMKIFNDTIYLPLHYTNSLEDESEFRIDLLSLNGEFLQSYSEATATGVSIKDLAINDEGIYIIGRNFVDQDYYYMDLIKYDHSGNLLFEKHFDGLSPSLPLIDYSNNIALAGENIVIGGGTDDFGIINGNILKVDSLGQLIWEMEFVNPFSSGNNGQASLMKILPVVSGGYVYTISYEFIGEEANYFDTFVVRVDENMEELWMYIADEGEEQNKQIHNLKVLSDGSIIGCGKNNNDPSMSDYSSMGWLFKLSAEGELLWEHNYYFASAEYPITNQTSFLSDIIETSDGGYAAIGAYQYVLYSSEKANLWLLKVDEEGCISPNCSENPIMVGIDEYSIELAFPYGEKYFTLAPNLVSTDTYIHFYSPINSATSSILITDIQGKKIDELKLLKGAKELKIVTSNYSNGMYVVSYMNEGRILQSEKLLVNQ